ncbi:MAG: hypothetical protein P0S95_08465 [Rhabdochlamydiaceae bacterium]|nr:hypothetical protein [Candidatus Amphrikana amoebophyrae]
MSPPLVISFFTKETYYEKEIQSLIRSLNEFYLEYDIEGLDSKGNWNENCHLKPYFILRKLKEHNRPILWLDADAIVVSPLSFFDNITHDLAVRILEPLPNDHHSKVISSTLYVKPTKSGFTYVENWCEISKSKWKIQNDQSCLRDVIFGDVKPENILSLPPQYCKISGLVIDDYIKEKAVIQQTQASRLYQKIIDKEVEDLPFLQYLSDLELKQMRM